MNKAVIGDCPRSEIVRDWRLSRIQRLSRVKDCLRSETVHFRRLSTVGDCQRALNEAIIGGCPKDLIYKNKSLFFWIKGHWVKHQ